MDRDLQVTVQVAVEAVCDRPEAFTDDARRSVLRTAEAAAMPEWLLGLLRETVQAHRVA